MKKLFNYRTLSCYLLFYLTSLLQMQAQTTIYTPEINNGTTAASCNLVRNINTVNLSGITAIQLEFWTSESISNLSSRIELTSSGGPDNGEYSTPFATLVNDSRRNQWQTLTIPFDITQVGQTVGNTTPNINAINFLRMYISGEPNGTYKVRNIRAVIAGAPFKLDHAGASNLSGVSVGSSYSGALATNASYLDFGGNGTYTQWNTSSAAGTATVSLRYSAENSARGIKLTVNGVDYASKNLTPTTSWNQWRVTTWTNVTFPANSTVRLTAVGNGPNVDQLTIGTITAGDGVAPSAPTNLTIANNTSNSVQLTWNASTDNVGVTGYNVYLNNTLLASNQTTRNYTFGNLSVGTAYQLKVVARDAAGNLSTVATKAVTLSQINKAIQAETANNLSGATISSAHTGAFGPNGQFLDYGGNGTFAQWNNVSGLPNRGSLTIRYSAENSTRGIRLTVDGVNYVVKTLNPTTSWSQWRVTTWTNVVFSANSTIRLTADGNGPNLDQFVVSGVSLSPPNGGGSGNIQLPIEVLGAEGTTETVQFTLNNLNGSGHKLELLVNNLSYQNKGSVKINGGAYLSLNHANVTMQPQAAARGGMVHGGYNTIRLTIPANGLQSGTNTISFRFDESDGISIGYRVVKMNILASNGAELLSNSVFTEDNPATWQAPLSGSSAIQAGKDLWDGTTKQLWNHYLPNGRKSSWYGKELVARGRILASCSDCHTKDGRDLELFSYSNKSIIERSKFHGLTQNEAEKITTYIRSLSASKPNVQRVGRPWNPPYQPGPAMNGETDMNKWAAGAGLDAVLENDADMLPYLFPNGVSKTQVEAKFNSAAMYDRTIIPLAIQFPDWKHWLPMIHPKDAYNASYLNSSSARKPLQGINNLRNYLDNYYSSNSTNNPPNDLINRLKTMYDEFRKFQEDGPSSNNHWRTDNGLAEQNLKSGVAHEFANTSLARLLAVKNFEFMQEFELQDKADEYVASSSDQPGARQWPSERYSVFEVPPHFTAKNSKSFEGQADEVGFYESTNWYNLQFILNGGNGFVGGTQPMDFNYHTPHVGRAIRSSGIREPLRYFSAIAQSWQIRTWSGQTGPGEKGYKLKQQGPWAFVGIDQNFDFFYTKSTTKDRPHIIVDQLEDIHPNLSKWVVGALLKQFNDEMDKSLNRLNAWPRTSDNTGSSTRLERAGKNNNDLDTDLLNRIGRKSHHHAEKLLFIIPIFKEIMGSDCAEVNRLIDWCKDAYPNITWPSNCSSSGNRTSMDGLGVLTDLMDEEQSILEIEEEEADFDGNSTSLGTLAGRNRTSLYPNPFTKTFMLSTNTLAADQMYFLKLHTTLGVLVHQQELQANTTAVQVTPNIASGMYLLTLYDQQGNVVQTHKIIKQ